MSVLQTVDGSLLSTRLPPSGGQSRIVVTEGTQTVPVAGGGRLTYEMIAEENPTCGAVVAKLTHQIATLPLRAYKGERDGERQVLAETHAFRRLLEYPAPRCSQSDLKEWLARPRYVHGN